MYFLMHVWILAYFLIFIEKDVPLVHMKHVIGFR